MMNLYRKKNDNWFTRLERWQQALLCGGIIAVALIAAVVLFVMSKWDKVDTQKIDAKDLIINQEVKDNNDNIDFGKGYTNVAFFGVDSRDGNLGKGNRSDCIIVASLNNETKEVKMVSVYRDTLLNLSEGSYRKCNAAYSFGGPVQAINMLNMNLDLDIREYVTVDFGAIADAIDLLGGLEIEVTEAELPYINKYIPETARSAGKKANLLKKAGLQTLDGTQATTYARIRSTAGGDFVRTERQRLVIEKMVEKAKKAGLGTINSIIDKVFPQVSTSFTLPEILKYATAYSEYRLVGNMGFPVDKSTGTYSGLGSIVIPQDLTSNVTQLHEFLFGRTGYVPSSTVRSISSSIKSTVSSASYSSGADSQDYGDEPENPDTDGSDGSQGSGQNGVDGQGSGQNGSSGGDGQGDSGQNGDDGTGDSSGEDGQGSSGTDGSGGTEGGSGGSGSPDKPSGGTEGGSGEGTGTGTTEPGPDAPSGGGEGQGQ